MQDFFLLVQANILSLLVLFLVLANLARMHDHQAILFKTTIFFLFALNFSEILEKFVLINSKTFSIIYFEFFYTLFINTIIAVSLGWTACVKNILFPLRSKYRSLSRLALALPAAAFFVYCFSNLYFHHMFSVDEQGGVYFHKPFWAVFTAGYLYVAVVLGMTFWQYLHSTNDLDRRTCLLISVFTVFGGVGAIAQYFSHYPSISITVTLGFTMLYASRNEDLISLDPLTRLNNRNSLVRYYDNRVKSKSLGSDSFLLFFDLNRFKYINDNYGHVSGDQALKIVSKALKHACINHDFFACRYGGDEFILFCNKIRETDIENVKQDVLSFVESERQEKNIKFGISLSLGWAEVPEKAGKLADLIAVADQNMYLDKQQHYRQEGYHARS